MNDKEFRKITLECEKILKSLGYRKMKPRKVVDATVWIKDAPRPESEALDDIDELAGFLEDKYNFVHEEDDEHHTFIMMDEEDEPFDDYGFMVDVYTIEDAELIVISFADYID